MFVDLDDFMIPADYARHIGKSITWVNALIKNKKLPFIEHNGRKLIPKNGVLPEYLNG